MSEAKKKKLMAVFMVSIMVVVAFVVAAAFIADALSRARKHAGALPRILFDFCPAKGV